ncbi:MAG TPA: sensor histidine kinase, partial [Nitriliruptorales bacterium]
VHHPVDGQLPLVLVLAGATGGFGSRILADSRRDADLALGQLDALRRTNRLLADVHSALGTLPAAPDARTVAAVTLGHLRHEIPFHAAAVLLREPHRGQLVVVHAVGARLTEDGTALVGATAEFVAATAAGSTWVGADGTLTGEAATLTAVPLHVHGHDIGHLVLQHDAAPVDIDALSAAADALALALDNARWLDRLTILSGEFERTRLARDLHDRLCQSLAAVSIALQRAAAKGDQPELSALGDQVRDDLADLRETLFELRAGPPAAGELDGSVRGYVARVAARAGIVADVDVACPGGRLPLAVEQQFFRILQELLRNVVCHAAASHVSVTWRVDEDRAVLEVEDDGEGFDPAGVDGDGLRTLRDRADALGARCEVDSQPGVGTVVTVTIDRRPATEGGPS